MEKFDHLSFEDAVTIIDDKLCPLDWYVLKEFGYCVAKFKTFNGN